ADWLINGIARTISHEMGHCFGLEHVVIDPNDDAMTHYMMGTPADGADGEPRDFMHDFGFQAISYMTAEGYAQNSHRYLTDTRAASTKPWLAVLKPGELTVVGDDTPNTITVDSLTSNLWFVINGNATTVIAASSPGLESLNPFDKP